MTAAGETETGFAEVNGTRLYYEVAGAGHPLVLVHAGIADNTMWDDQFPAFAERYRVVRFDMRGYGRSPKPPAPYSVRGDLHALLRHLGIERTYLLGCSIGGSTAVDFTLDYPDMVDALVLVGAALSGYQPQSDDLTARWEEIEAAFEAGDLARVTELETRMWVDGPNRTPDAVDPAVRARAYAMGLRVNEGYTEEGVEQPLDPPAADRLGEIRVPTLVIVGDQDVSDILETAGVLASRIVGARKVVIPNTAHLPNMEQPALFTRTVLDFLGAL